MLPELPSWLSFRRTNRRLAKSARVRTGRQQPRSLQLEEMERRLLFAIAPVVTETGLVSLSVDGVGTNLDQGTVQVLKPAGATVRGAYLAAASAGLTGRRINDGDVKIDGVAVAWSISTPSSISSWNHWANVTSLVSAKINAAPAGLIDFTVTESASLGIDGEILAVIFDDPNETVTNTVALLFGAQDIAGDTFAIGLSEPLDRTNPNLALDLSLGISFGFQTANNLTQRSIVDVNGQRLTSIAGGQDDGVSLTGGLLTVGGIGDSNSNPDPSMLTSPLGFRADDELYDLLPLVEQGDTSIRVFTQNPSNDDNIFFAALSLKGTTAVVGEGILLAPADELNQVGETHTITATVQGNLGQPIVSREVTFTIVAGPHAGQTATVATDSAGKATFAYTGTVAGDDLVEAQFLNGQGNTVLSNRVVSRWLATNRPPTASIGGPYTVDEGDAISLAAVGTDLDGDTLTYAWDLDNDGHFETPGQSVTFSADGRDGPSSQAVAVRVDDGQGNVVINTGFVTVVNVAPTAVLVGENVTYGTPLTVHFTSEFDPSALDVAAGFRYAFTLDSQDLSSFTYANASTSATGDFGLLNAGTYTVYGRIIDKDGGYTQHELQLDVNRANLTIDVDDQIWQIGTPFPNFTGTLSGQQNSEAFTVVYSSSADATSKVGQYPITAAVTGPTLSNYNVTVNDGTLQVTAAVIDASFRVDKLNIEHNGAVALVIAGSSQFDVTQLRLDSLTLAGIGITAFNRTFEDVDGDGYQDLIVQFKLTTELKNALHDIYIDLLMQDQADDGQFSTTQRSLLSLDGVFGQYEQQFQSTAAVDLFLVGKSLRAVLDALQPTGRKVE